MIYARYHAQRAAKISAERAQMRQELAEMRGEAPVAEVAQAEQPAPAPQPTAAAPSQPQQQHRHDNQKRR